MVRAVSASGTGSRCEGHLWIQLFSLLAFCSCGLYGFFQVRHCQTINVSLKCNFVLNCSLV